ncbi:MAG TPA: hypothetical protein PK203_14595 [Cyclobacteriaceae bacterium]|nr:hypothetical protein [Cyclobacteriaceae bacterium]
MTRALLVVLVYCALLVSCTEKVICPAYQSAYIYDKEELRKKFSYFKEDSTPKVYAANKNKYLIGESVPYRKKNRSLQTIAMKPVQPVVPDSLKDDGMDAEMNMESVDPNVNDSTAVIRIDTLGASDSVYMISKDKEVRVLKYNPMQRKYYVDTIGFNTEQDNYMWYLRDILLLPDVKIAKEKADEAKKDNAKEQKKKKGIRGFFSKLFRKKDKSKVAPDTTENIQTPQEDYGYDEFEGKKRDSTAVVTPSNQQPKVEPKKKKGIFSFLKKDKSEPKKKETDPAKKEDEKDDGF